MTDGKDVFEVLGASELLDLTRRPGEVVCYPLGRWVTEVRTKAEEALGVRIRRSREPGRELAMAASSEG